MRGSRGVGRMADDEEREDMCIGIEEGWKEARA
jgi:hypothetical protein